jgi:hypothetical protein
MDDLFEYYILSFCEEGERYKSSDLDSQQRKLD